MLDFMRGLSKGKLPERDQSLFAKEVLQSTLRLLPFVHDASLEPIEQGSGCEIYHHDFIRLLYHPVGHRLTNSDPADLPYLIFQTLQILHLHLVSTTNP